MTKYTLQLRRLIEDYYHQQLTVDEYRARRKLIFDAIERESAGGESSGEARKATSMDESTSHS
jgi:hypothetical protein